MSGRLSVSQRMDALPNAPAFSTGDTDTDVVLSSFATFDLSGIPEGAEIDTAVFATRQTAVSGAPFANLGGSVDLASVSFATVSGLALENAPAKPVGALSTSPDVGPRTMDVKAQVADDLENRVAQADRSQLRMSCPTGTRGNGATDRAEFLVPERSIEYLLP